MTNAINNWPIRLRMEHDRVVHAAQPADARDWAAELYELRCLARSDRALAEVPHGGDRVLDPATDVTCVECLRSDA